MIGTIVITFAFSALVGLIFSYIKIGQRHMVARFVYLFFGILALTYFYLFPKSGRIK